MTHKELVEASASYMKRVCKLVVTELSSQLLTEAPDVIGWKYDGTSYMYECKVSRADFLQDKNKKARQKSRAGFGQMKYYVAVEGIIKTEDLPQGWGLIEVSDYKFRTIKHATKLRNSLLDERIALIQIARYQNDPVWCQKHHFYADL